MKTKICLFIILALYFSSASVNAQQFDRLSSGDKLLTVNGGINLNQIFYTAYGNELRRDPYNFFLSGNLNFDFIGFAVPLSFSYSNKNTSFQQPFNQFSLSPTYKNIRTYIGYNSLNYSKYTLAGHIFFGGAVEVSDLGKWDVSAMYGRLRKPVEPDSLSDNAQPSFRRLGWGTKINYRGKGGDRAGLIVFGSNDQEFSLQSLENSGILPESNLVISLEGSKQLTKQLSVKAEYATSAITRNQSAGDNAEEQPLAFNILNGLYQQNSSTAFYNALNSSLTYSGKSYNVALNYERVDPEYETHGAYFFNNDLENITVSTQLNLLQSKVNLGLNAGSQRNNLENTELNELRRFVGSANLNYTPKPTIALAASYSNFQSFTNIRPTFDQLNDLTPFDNLDTLNFRQISQNANLNANIILNQSKEKRQNLNFNIAYQTSKDEQENSGIESIGNQFVNANVSYTYSVAATGFSITSSINGYVNENTGNSNSGISPTLSLSKPFFNKKVRTTVSSTYTLTKVNEESSAKIFNLRLGASYSLKKKHRINFNFVTLNRGRINNNPTGTESTGTLSYQYNF
ncbi:MAG: hypothetical protein AAFQ94_25390 [Bacteroidota bacterium]